MYHLYAFTEGYDNTIADVAYVSTHKSSEDAAVAKRFQENCYSDEGIHFVVHTKHPNRPPNTTYYDMIERRMK